MSEDNSVAVDTQEVAPIVPAVEETTTPDLLSNEPKDEVTTEAPASEQTQVASEDFINSVSEEYRGKITQKGFKDVNDIVKAYDNLESKFGKRLEDLTAEELRDLDPKFGAPESADAYELELSDDMVKDPILGDISNDLFNAGIPKDKAESLIKGVTEKLNEQQKLAETNAVLEAEENVKTLKQEFGAAFDQRIQAANKALTELGGQDAIEAIQTAGLANNPAIVKLLAEAGKFLTEDTPVGNKDEKSFGITPNEAQSKISELQADKAFMDRWRNAAHPGHKEAASQMEKLYRLKAGKK
jgi:hypothetical protein